MIFAWQREICIGISVHIGVIFSISSLKKIKNQSGSIAV